MRSIGIRELKARASQIVREVCERQEPFAVTRRGRVVARLTPVEPPLSSTDEQARVWADWDELAAEIALRWPRGVSAVDVVAEQRRDL